jgi:hypothetical protein
MERWKHSPMAHQDEQKAGPLLSIRQLPIEQPLLELDEASDFVDIKLKPPRP